MLCGSPDNPGGVGLRANGDPCGNQVIAGGTRCAMHGGLTPVAKVKAEQALALLRMPALELLHQLIDQAGKNECESCGYPKANAEEKRVLVRMIQLVLDRAGLGPRSTIDINHRDTGLDISQLDGLERVELHERLTGLSEFTRRVQRRLHSLAFGVDATKSQGTKLIEGEVLDTVPVTAEIVDPTTF